MLDGSSALASFIGWWLPAIGVVACALYLYANLQAVVQMMWSSTFGDKRSLRDRYGPWAVITGSSDGIGKEYAINLAREGVNLILISRTGSKLAQLADNIRSQYDVQVRWMAVDFAEGDGVYDRIQKELANVDLGLLVNNVGMLHEHPVTMDELPLQDLKDTYNVNMMPLIRLTYALLPAMKARHRGMIVNVTSASGFLPIPYLNMYAGSKAFVTNFSLGLKEELRGTGVDCQLVFPMFVDTNLTQRWQSTNLWQYLFSAKVVPYSRMAVWTIGKVAITTGYWQHGMVIAYLRTFPRWMLTIFMGHFMRYVKATQCSD